MSDTHMDVAAGSSPSQGLSGPAATPHIWIRSEPRSGCVELLRVVDYTPDIRAQCSTRTLLVASIPP